MTLSRRKFISTTNTLIAGATLTAVSTPNLAQSSAQKSTKQTSGVYRFTVGDFEVTAILDGYLTTRPGQINGYSEAEAKAALKNARRPVSEKSMDIAVNG